MKSVISAHLCIQIGVDPGHLFEVKQQLLISDTQRLDDALSEGEDLRPAGETRATQEVQVQGHLIGLLTWGKGKVERFRSSSCQWVGLIGSPGEGKVERFSSSSYP